MTRKRCIFAAKSMPDAQKTGAKRACARPARFCARFCSITTVRARDRCVFCAFLVPTARFWTPKMTRKWCAFGATSTRDAQKTGAKRARARPARFARVLRHQTVLRARSVRVFARFRRRRRGFERQKMTRKRRKINARRAENRRKTRARSAGVFCARLCGISTVCARVRCVFCAFSAPTARF